jgi:hypothetical protein
LTREYINFEVLKENWSIYKLKDESLIKCKFILIKIMTEGEDSSGKPLLSIQAQNVVGVVPNLKSLGNPVTVPIYNVKDLNSRIVEPNVQFEIVKNEPNIYQLQNGDFFTIRQDITRIARTTEFDQAGEPVYIVDTEASPTLERRQFTITPENPTNPV